MFVNRSKEGSDETDDCSEGKRRENPDDWEPSQSARIDGLGSNAVDPHHGEIVYGGKERLHAKFAG